ncbi:aminotransferase, class V [Teladorsagia circumcincta]|uniref:Aminotransferase, class V n=1 Tax=Teladorsagia circumcincta TaxID=45464 RepID=A0A2G9UAH4_TELCI|nr:aminotransferase, class V [Teladorsagia circumcincta]
MILDHFDVTSEEYAVVFTANATHALRIVADNFEFDGRDFTETRFSTLPQGKGPMFAYLRDSHNSVVGMREVVKGKVEEVLCVDRCEVLLNNVNCGLFTMTAMSNFCGRKYDLSLVAELERLGWWICLDAASLVSTSHLSLKEVRPHFVAISFYKIFGYPTGIGALLVRRDAINRLQPRAFAGGTVRQILSDEFYSVLRDNIEERLEQGTLNYYAICALSKGFDDLKRHGAFGVFMTSTSRKLLWLPDKQSPIVVKKYRNFDDISIPRASKVAKMAALYGIDLRTGCFCNSGACQMYLEHSNDQLRHYFEV